MVKQQGFGVSLWHTVVEEIDMIDIKNTKILEFVPRNYWNFKNLVINYINSAKHKIA